MNSRPSDMRPPGADVFPSVVTRVTVSQEARSHLDAGSPPKMRIGVMLGPERGRYATKVERMLEDARWAESAGLARPAGAGARRLPPLGDRADAWPEVREARGHHAGRQLRPRAGVPRAWP